jgi:hypothetical protein
MLTLGSETSGGIRNIEAYNLKGLGTVNGIRFKSASVRGGVVEKIFIHDIQLDGVENPLHFELNWYPAYSYPAIPAALKDKPLPAHWAVLTRRVEPPERGLPEFREIVISNLVATGASQAIYANAYAKKPISGVRLENIRIEAEKAGAVSHATDWKLNGVVISTPTGENLHLKNTSGLSLPEVNKSTSARKASASKPAGSSDPKPAQQLGLGNEAAANAKR